MRIKRLKITIPVYLKGLIAVMAMLLWIAMPSARAFANEAEDASDGGYRSLDELNKNATASEVQASGSGQPEYTRFSDLNGKTISMLTGAPFEELISSKVPDVKGFTYYQSMPDMVLGIKSGKTDAGFMNNAVA